MSNRVEVKNKLAIERMINYRIFSQLFSCPWFLVKTISELQPASDVADAICELMKNVSQDDLKIEYGRIFGHTPNSDFPLYETMYGKENIFQQSSELADIAGFYKAWGLDISSGTERIDHISTELEFMGFLCMRQAVSTDAELEMLQSINDSQKEFMQDHLGRWSLLFAEALSKKTDSEFFRKSAELFIDFIESEITNLDAKPARYRSIDGTQKSQNPVTSCFECAESCSFAEEVDLKGEIQC